MMIRHLSLTERTASRLRKGLRTRHQPGDNPEEPTGPEFWEPETQRRLDAAVIIDVPCNDPWYFRIRNLSLPVVGEFTDFDIAKGDVLTVIPGLRALARQGCARIALLTASPACVRPLFEKGLTDLDLVTDPHWIRGEFNGALPGAGWDEFREIWSAGPEKPDGLLVTDDVLERCLKGERPPEVPPEMPCTVVEVEGLPGGLATGAGVGVRGSESVGVWEKL